MLSSPFASVVVPTAQTYGELTRVYGFFNARLFESKLPGCLITLQREKRTCGYFSSERFANLDGVRTDEIALNPAYFAVVPLVETLQTLVHEMVHLWQAHFGTPGRGRYHNAEWADKMESIGLMPSSTGRPGGQRTGDRMADYAMTGGRFLAACAELITQEFRLSWYDRFPAVEHVVAGQSSQALQLAADVGGGALPTSSPEVRAALVTPAAMANGASGAPGSTTTPINRSNRVKYRCDCASAWGKPGLLLSCRACDRELAPVEAEASVATSEP